jgi:hypothetical protein
VASYTLEEVAAAGDGPTAEHCALWAVRIQPTRGDDYTRGVLILPPGHAEQLAARHTLNARERWILSSLGTLVVALLVAVVIGFAQSSPKSGHGCVYVSIPSSMGAQPYAGCGAKARRICAQVGVPGGYSGSLASALLPACRMAGLPVKSI